VSRTPLLEEWRGLRDSDLDKFLLEETGAVFVHATGFIGGHKTLKGAILMAKKSINGKKD
jgi:uncharacterized UPF0160 family protein